MSIQIVVGEGKYLYWAVEIWWGIVRIYMDNSLKSI
jgi:hypothetical protein